MTASSFLAYGGTLQVVRAPDAALRNARLGSASAPLIKSGTHYNQLGYDDNTITNITVAAKTPGTLVSVESAFVIKYPSLSISS